MDDKSYFVTSMNYEMMMRMFFARLALTSIGSFTRILVTLSLPFYLIVIFMCSRLPCYVYMILPSHHDHLHINIIIFFFKNIALELPSLTYLTQNAWWRGWPKINFFPYICICICNRTNMRRTHQQNLLLSAFNFHKTKFFNYFFWCCRYK